MTLKQLTKQPLRSSMQMGSELFSRLTYYLPNKSTLNEKPLQSIFRKHSTLNPSFPFFKLNKMKVHIDGVEIKTYVIDHEGNKVEFLSLPESQIYAWRILKPMLKHQLSHISGRVPRAVDIGCGSGFFSILLKKNLGYYVSAIDKNGDAIKLCRKNAYSNEVRLDEIKFQYYGPYSYKQGSADLILLSPPFFIYPPEIQPSIPSFARSGRLGLSELFNQLRTAEDHLADNGLIAFFSLLGGDQQEPEIIKRYREKGFFVEFKDFIQPIASHEFLEKLFGETYTEFQKEYSQTYSHIHLGMGLIRKEAYSRPKGMRRTTKTVMGNENWDTLIDLHKKNFTSSN